MVRNGRHGIFLAQGRDFLLTVERTNGKVENSLQSGKAVRVWSLTKEAAAKEALGNWLLVFGKRAQNPGSSWVTLGQIGST
jgi:hypothetical protein